MEATELEPRQAEEAVDNGARQQLIVFKLGEEEYGITIDQIKEVVFTPNITPMPQVPSYIKGVANIRGNILAIVDLREKFGLQTQKSDADESSSNYTLVVASSQLNVGILVKEVPNTLTVSTSDIEDTASIMQGSQEGRQYIKGIVKVDKKLVILIDVFAVMQDKEISQTLTSEAITNE
ncbi:chemotaxis protein CheW [Tunicatimonas pelagia]|uniref:chemotaxis protein CheW n=1 Tax=Tunicatimonas pelagia TaxID=931531 RepID=UPI002666C9C7|nr:chemotaxis protein CheW [Tunicatimonas pelagia]WKN41380.1 chemotaxis protein CheW [Tunicatimonas pelagia]